MQGLDEHCISDSPKRAGRTHHCYSKQQWPEMGVEKYNKGPTRLDEWATRTHPYMGLHAGAG